MPKPVQVLLTRPESQSQRLAKALVQDWGPDIVVTVSPLMKTVYLTADEELGGYEALVLTSETGAEAAARLIKSPHDCFCVGERTAAVARRARFRVRHVAASAAGLIDHLRAARPASLLHLHGRDVSVHLYTALAGSGIRIASAVVYDQQKSPFSHAAKGVLRGENPVVVPFFSARSVRLFHDAAPKARIAPIHACAISQAVAEELSVAKPTVCLVAETPDGPGMQQALRRVISSLVG